MNALERLGIEYYHCPELGIASDKRDELVTQADYDALFEEYENTVLKKNHHSIRGLSNLLNNRKRIAVTCFEKLPQQCHRTRVAKAVLKEITGQINFLEV